MHLNLAAFPIKVACLLSIPKQKYRFFVRLFTLASTLVFCSILPVTMMNNGEEFTVTSEILPFLERDTGSEVIIHNKHVCSKLKINVPDLGSDEEDDSDEKDGRLQVKKDNDGDYIMPRNRLITNIINLEHSVYTTISEVGLQIWRAALLLADFVIHNQRLFKNQTVLELGSGVGLTSIVAGMFAKQVVSTDLDNGNVLKLLRSNIERNRHIIKGDVCVLGLDFFSKEWSPELQEKLEEVSIVMAADVIYDNDVTNAFVKTLTKILSTPPSKTVYLALEKRYVFTISDLDTSAPCFDHMIACIRNAQSRPPFSEWSFVEMPLNFPKYFNYARTKQLVMFKILT